MNLVTNLEVWIEGIPWMWSKLLESESDALLLVVEVEDNDVELLVELNDFLRIAYAAPREVCDMDESVNTFFDFNEYTEVSEVANLSNMLRTYRVLLSFFCCSSSASIRALCETTTFLNSWLILTILNSIVFPTNVS